MQAPGTMPGRPGQYPPGMGHLPGTPPNSGAPGRAPRHPIGAPGAQPTAPAAQPATGPAAQQPPTPPPQAVVPAAALPPSLLDKPPQAALVHLSDQLLTVTANNSSLSEILKDLASSGMTVDGMDKDLRVFGVYGPGNPSDILATLLDGAGYNFVMVGATSTGTPRQIVLTARSNAPPSAPQARPTPPPDDDDEPLVVNNPPDDEPSQRPGAMPGDPRQPRTPAEMLQELQRMRQEQQQQQQQPQQQPQ
jgi:hypothetical protein